MMAPPAPTPVSGARPVEDFMPTDAPNITDAFQQPGYTDPGNYERPNLAPFQGEIDASQQRLDVMSNPNNPNYQKVQDNDRGFWKRLGAVLREAVIQGGQGWAQNANIQDPWQRLAAAGGAAIGGGVGYIANPTVDEQRTRDTQIGEERARLGDYYAQQKLQTDAQYKQAQSEYQMQRPEIERQKITAKVTEEAQKQINRLEVLREKDALEGKKWTLLIKNGKMYKKYPDREEPLTGPDGQQEVDLAKTPQSYKLDDGRTVYMTGSQIANAEGLKAYRDATLALGRDRLQTSVDEAQKDREFKARFEAAKIQAQSAFQQLKAAQGQEKALQQYRAKYIEQFQKATGRAFKVGDPEDERLVNEYLAALTVQ
jgi:hypothetical protein